MKYDVFISYRRESGTYQARALKSDLELNGYKNRVFMDTHSLKGGDFTKKIRDMIQESCNFVVIISQGCFVQKKKGIDYFIYEISQALKLGKNVIPVYYDGVIYEDIKKHIDEIEDFPKQNPITYHADSPDETITKIISFLKTENELLKERFESVSREKAVIRQKLLLLNEESQDLKCPICKNNYSAAMSFCQTCGYKFFDKLELSVAQSHERIQEKERTKKHNDIWLGYCKQREHQGDDEQIKSLQSTITELKSTLSKTQKELSTKEKELEESEKQRKELELLLSNLTDNNLIDKNILEIKLNENVTFQMIYVEGGNFMMGVNNGDSEANNDENPSHQVTLSSYYVGKTAVTQTLWEAVMGNNPSTDKGPFHPVINVSWDNCQEFIRKLNKKTNRTFRLPTEAEWEFAARGGNMSKGFKYAGSNNIKDVAWCDDDAWNPKSHPVAQKQPNELGLYDMSGNVWEWCQDFYGIYNSESQINPTGPNDGRNRIIRGGGLSTKAKYCRVSFRGSHPPLGWRSDLGLRLVLQITSLP